MHVCWGYFHAYVGSDHFFFGGGGVKILNFNILGVFRKNEYFLEYEDFVDIVWGSSRLAPVLKTIFNNDGPVTEPSE